MNVFVKFDEILSMIFQDIKERKRNGHKDGRTDNVKTVYPPTNIVCGGYKCTLGITKWHEYRLAGCQGSSKPIKLNNVLVH